MAADGEPAVSVAIGVENERFAKCLAMLQSSTDSRE